MINATIKGAMVKMTLFETKTLSIQSGFYFGVFDDVVFLDAIFWDTSYYKTIVDK